jgi:predicted dienelactone hydrolase
LPDFIARPTDSKRLIDFMLNKSPTASQIDPRGIGFFGFSFTTCFTSLSKMSAQDRNVTRRAK